MNMWAGGRAYGYIRFKKSVPTENRGVGGAACPGHGSGSRADVVITINNRNSRTQKVVLSRWSSVLASAVAGRPATGVCFAVVNLCAYWNISPVVTLPPCPYKI